MKSFKNTCLARIRTLALVPFIAAVLAACGQTGPLFMPEPHSPQPAATDTQKPQNATIKTQQDTKPENP